MRVGSWGLLRHLAEDPEVRATLAALPRPRVGFNDQGLDSLLLELDEATGA